MGPVKVGERIRQLRLGLGMSLRALATTERLFSSLISQVEHSQATPSIGPLERIAMGLGVSLGRFFIEPDPSAPRPMAAPVSSGKTQSLLHDLHSPT